MPRKTYRVGRRTERHWPVVIVLVAALVVSGVGYAIYRVVSYVPPATDASVVVTPEPEPSPPPPTAVPEEKQPFSFDTKSVNWSFIKHNVATYNFYAYSTTDLAGGKHYLDVYVDEIPTALAVNRLVRIAAKDTKLAYGKVSEPCQTLPAQPSTAQPGQAQSSGGSSQSIPVKWDGVEFLCDKQNTNQNTVGTSTDRGVKLELTGKTAGKHSYFFVYTDNTAKPDYEIFYKVLASFEAI